MKPDDPRLAGYDLRATFHIDPEGAWPRPGEVTVIVAVGASRRPRRRRRRRHDPRASCSYPSRYRRSDRSRSPVSSADATCSAICPTRRAEPLRLRAALGRRRDLGDATSARPRTRARTSSWRSTRASTRGAGWRCPARCSRDAACSGSTATAGSLALAKPPADDQPPKSEPPVRVPAAPPPEVVFSAPTEDETDVSLATNVRIQFSRDIDPATLKGRVRVDVRRRSGATAASRPRQRRVHDRSTTPANRVLEMKFTKPLERFRTRQGGAARRHPRHGQAAAEALDADLPTGRIVSRQIARSERPSRQQLRRSRPRTRYDAASSRSSSRRGRPSRSGSPTRMLTVDRPDDRAAPLHRGAAALDGDRHDRRPAP